jgi:hypothetical protein
LHAGRAKSIARGGAAVSKEAAAREAAVKGLLTGAPAVSGLVIVGRRKSCIFLEQ